MYVRTYVCVWCVWCICVVCVVCICGVCTCVCVSGCALWGWVGGRVWLATHGRVLVAPCCLNVVPSLHRSVLEEEFLCYKDLQPGSVVTVSPSNNFVNMPCAPSYCRELCSEKSCVHIHIHMFSCTGQDCKLRHIWDGDSGQPLHSRPVPHPSPC